MTESFRPIQGIERGYSALTLYAPGEFMPFIQEWGAFVGGCGVGQRNTREAAKKLLLEAAIRDCDRKIQYGQKMVDHYEKEKTKLLRDGLIPE